MKNEALFVNRIHFSSSVFQSVNLHLLLSYFGLPTSPVVVRPSDIFGKLLNKSQSLNFRNGFFILQRLLSFEPKETLTKKT